MSRRALRIVTWNVWFDEWQRPRRQDALWETLAGLRPDVICLQEVLPGLLETPGLRALRDGGAWISEGPVRDYDTLLISQIPVLRSERMPLVSYMGRNLLSALLDTDPPLTVATVHLESTTNMTPFRVRQLEDITVRLAREPNAILVGDMNFPADADRLENVPLAGWRDAWLVCRPDDPGYTVDSDVNVMRAQSKGVAAQRARLDRAFLHGDGWQVRHVERLGTEKIAGSPPAHVSDHFGLQIDLVAAHST
jgi:tyrosyl-DNA phosphodiesterase 2